MAPSPAGLPRYHPPVAGARKPRFGRAPIVVVGDLNAADDALIEILRGTGLLGARDRWTGGRAELVQLGDVWNRGPGARRAFELLLRLRVEARAAGGKVTVLLGNHEVMTALRHEAYCTEEEYLAFATARERQVWPGRVDRALRRILRDHPPHGPVDPLEPRLAVWRALNAPGRAALRRALAPRARLGRALRSLPVAHRVGDAVFTHAGLSPHWARRGIDGLNRDAIEAWRSASSFYRRLPRSSLFRSATGPLWNRDLVRAEESKALERSLAILGARRMIVGHTRTHTLPGGSFGSILTRFDARLVCVDVELASGAGAPRAALVIDGLVGIEWTPAGQRILWRDR